MEGGKNGQTIWVILLVMLVATFNFVGKLMKGRKGRMIKMKEKKVKSPPQTQKRPPNALLLIWHLVDLNRVVVKICLLVINMR